VSLTPGTRLGPYQIVASIGAGGMGEVYRARDTRLDRDVAVKVLTSSLARDPDALARFEREALTVAKLSHPNILSIYEFGRDQDTAYVVTELIEGETLRAKLAAGALSPRRAVAYGQQIARGIAAAHARGIVHRDLKPENVMIARDDQVKLLDFGLAKPVAPRSGDETRALSANTSAGTVLGTFGYMAPEQVRGLDVDHRADIFSFGSVLYEMLSGERAFKGETVADTMTAILTKDPPDFDVAKLAIPPALERIVRRCLEKPPDLRFQSADDLAFALETVSTASGPAAAQAFTAPVPRRVRASWLPWGIAAVATAAAIVVRLMHPAAANEPPWHFSQLTDAAGEETSPTIAPDGTTVAYAMQRNGRWGIYAQRVGGRNATPIVADPEHDYAGPAYSPDGQSIAFHESDSDGGIFIAGATGESMRRLTEHGFNPAWSPDGKSIAFATEEVNEPAARQTTSHLFVVDASSGTPREITPDSEDAIQPAWSPDGERIAFWSNTDGQRDIFTIPAAGGSRLAVTNDAALDWSPEWSPDGRSLFFSSDRGGSMNLWRIAIDERTGATTGQPQPITNGVQASASLARFSKTGARMAFRSRVKAINPVKIPFDPDKATTGVPVALDGSNNIRVPSDVSPDGTELALFSITELQEDLFISSTDGSRMRRLTDDPPRDRAPMFTRDGKSIVFYSNRDGNWAGWTLRLDGSGLKKMWSVPGGVIYILPSPVSDDVIFSSAANAQRVYKASLHADVAPVLLPHTTAGNAAITPTAWTADGARLAGPVFSATGAGAGVATYDLRSGFVAVVSNDPTYGVRWLPDNRRVLYFTGGFRQLVMLDTVTKERTIVPAQLPGRSIDDVFALSRDGRAIYYGAVRTESDIWIAWLK
jgi:Tol biopolymer transport system component